MEVQYGQFIWDAEKENANIKKHGVDFRTAAHAFLDPLGQIAEDIEHSHEEDRFYCIGWVGAGVLTVWFAYRLSLFRLIGAGYLSKGRRLYEEKNGKRI